MKIKPNTGMHMSLVKQQGSALLVSLVILTVITMGAMVALQRSGIQIRMLSNLQHQHELENAAMSTLNSIYTQMLNDTDVQRNILVKTDNQFTEAEQDSSEDSQLAIFTTFKDDITEPTFEAKSVKSVTANIQKLPSPDGSFYLKGTKGCGSGCAALHVAVDTNVKGKNNIAEINQEIGIRRLIPSAQ